MLFRDGARRREPVTLPAPWAHDVLVREIIRGGSLSFVLFASCPPPFLTVLSRVLIQLLFGVS